MSDMIVFDKEYVHYKNGLTYIPVNRCKIQESNVWVEAIIYKTESEELFVRSLEEFQNKFTKK